MHDLSPLTADEQARLRTPRAPHATGEVAGRVLREDRILGDRVLFDQPGDGRIWVRGATYKASFGAEGFVYVPFLGADAPRNYPVQFVLRSVRVGGRDLAFAASVPATRQDARVTFDRGSVREIYDLAARQVEQTFVVDADLAGEVEIELQVVSELVEDGAQAGLQFGNALGQVCYGTAYLVDGAHKHEISSTWDDGRIRMHVPAASRGTGPVVIDPIIHTSSFTTSGSQNSGQPDIAYDATSDQYMVVWQYHFSATDYDVYSEFRRGDGSAVPGSLGVIDLTTLRHSSPRVANLNQSDRFLVVMERVESNRWHIWGRLRLAGAAPHPIVFPISDPSFSGNCVAPDVGGDPADSGPSTKWLVAWTRELSTTDYDIHARTVNADTSMAPFTTFIENSAGTIYNQVMVSQSNGNGFTVNPRWMVVYQFRFSATDWDIYGATLDPSGAVTRPSQSIDTSPFVDLVPSVSTPVIDNVSGNPLFMVTYERQSPIEAWARVLSAGFVNQINPTSLTQRFGLGGFWVRAESDGCRFAVLTGLSTISVATLAVANGGLVQHEAPQTLPGVPSYPRIASKRSGGGSPTDYGIAFVDEAPTPDVIMVAGYRGHAGGDDVTRRTMACGGLGIDAAGRPFLGETLRFSLSNTGSDVVGQLLGLPAPALTLCFGCSLGVNLGGPLVNFPGVQQLVLPLPCEPTFVGAALAVQGYAAGSGTCFGSLRFSDTIDFVIR